MESISSDARTPSASPIAGTIPTSDVPVRRLPRIESFDGLRGATVIIVFVSHLEVILPIPTFAVVPGGTVSLDSFFVLSGFLITSLLLREQGLTGQINTIHFYRRRAMRLLPPLFGLLVAHSIFAYLTGISFHEEWTSLMSVLFYYSNWKLAFNSNYVGGIANGMQHLWSLSLEEQFYLIWPWITIFVLTYRRRFRTVAVVLLGLIVAIAVHRSLSYHGTNWYAIFIRTDTRADGILIGCLLAHIWFRGLEPNRTIVRWAATVASVFLLICLPIVKSPGPFLFRGGFVAIDVACALIILALVDGHWGGRHFFNWRPFIVLGTVSYAFYLWHLPVFFAIRYYGHSWNAVVRVVVAVGATLLFTALSWCLLERPALDWKDRLEGRNPVPRLGLKSLRRPAATILQESPLAKSAAPGPSS
ncbi:MAG: acyltransferase [Acidimicrobiales bacterium]|nr:acyltransferase [Acidimicrobiales bacterium]